MNTAMNQIQIATATFEDVEEILTIQNTSPESAQWSRSTYTDMLSACGGKENSISRTVLCARLHERIIGFAVVSSLRVSDGTKCELENLAVAADHRRSGVGTVLLKAVIELCKQSGEACINTEVRASNAAALYLYKKNKFVPLAMRKAYYKHPEEDAIVLQWTSD